MGRGVEEWIHSSTPTLPLMFLTSLTLTPKPISVTKHIRLAVTVKKAKVPGELSWLARWASIAVRDQSLLE